MASRAYEMSSKLTFQFDCTMMFLLKIMHPFPSQDYSGLWKSDVRTSNFQKQITLSDNINSHKMRKTNPLACVHLLLPCDTRGDQWEGVDALEKQEEI